MEGNHSENNMKISGDVPGVAAQIMYNPIIKQDHHYHSNDEKEITLKRKLTPVSPYVGLEKFKTGDKDKFFGREKWINELSEYLLKEDNVLLLVLGASGIGKSSLIQAGLIPKLKDVWDRFVELTFHPDKNPFKSLSSSLEREYGQSKVETAGGKKDTLTLIKAVESLKNGSKWLIFIDQFEELFTTTEKAEREKFVDSLVQLIQQQKQNKDSSVKIVLAMRADFLHKFSESSKFGDIYNDHSNYLLTKMNSIDLKLAIAKPAINKGVWIEEELVGKVIDDFYKQEGSLPLLQYTLNLLWEKSDINEKQRELKTKTYDELGGVNSALNQQADNIYNELNNAEQEAAKQIFIELVNLVDEKYVSRRTEKSKFLGSDVKKSVLEKLIEGRLLVSGEEQEKATVEVAHEQLLISWKFLTELIREKEETIITRNRLIADAQEWHKQKANEELWIGDKLEKVLKQIKEQEFADLGEEVKQFLDASIKWNDRSEQEKLEREIDASIAESKRLFDSNKRLDALVELIEAGKIWQNELEKYEYSRLRFLAMLGQVFSELAEYNSINAYEYDEVTSVSWNPVNQIIASASSRGIIKIWSANGTFKGKIDVKEGAIGDLTFSSDGKFLASASSNSRYGTITLWEISIDNTDPKKKKKVKLLKPDILGGHLDGVNSISFSPGDINSNLEDEIILASASQDETVKLWNRKGTAVKTLKGHKGFVKCVAFSPDGKTIASGDFEGVVIIWSRDGELLKSIQAHTGPVTSINFCPDSKVLVSSSRDKHIKFWNTNGESAGQLPLHQKDREVLYVTFSPDGRLMASTDIGGNIKLWFKNEKQWSQKSKLMRTFKHEKEVPKVSFSKDGKRLISCSHDKTIKFWNCFSKFDGYDNGKFQGHTDWITSIEFNVDDKTITTASEDGIVKTWNYDGNLLPTRSNYNNETYPEAESSQNSKFIDLSRDGQMTATVEQNENGYEINLKNRIDGELKKGISSAKLSILDLKFSQSDKTIILISRDYIELWKSEDLSKPESIQLGSDRANGYISAARLSSDWSKIAVAYFGTDDGHKEINRIRLWNLDLKEALKEAELYVQSYQN